LTKIHSLYQINIHITTKIYIYIYIYIYNFFLKKKKINIRFFLTKNKRNIYLFIYNDFKGTSGKTLTQLITADLNLDFSISMVHANYNILSFFLSILFYHLQTINFYIYYLKIDFFYKFIIIWIHFIIAMKYRMTYCITYLSLVFEKLLYWHNFYPYPYIHVF